MRLNIHPILASICERSTSSNSWKYTGHCSPEYCVFAHVHALQSLLLVLPCANATPLAICPLRSFTAALTRSFSPTDSPRNTFDREGEGGAGDLCECDSDKTNFREPITEMRLGEYVRAWQGWKDRHVECSYLIVNTLNTSRPKCARERKVVDTWHDRSCNVPMPAREQARVVCVCVCVRVCACVHARVRACVCLRARVCAVTMVLSFTTVSQSKRAHRSTHAHSRTPLYPARPRSSRFTK